MGEPLGLNTESKTISHYIKFFLNDIGKSVPEIFGISLHYNNMTGLKIINCELRVAVRLFYDSVGILLAISTLCS